MDQGRQAEWLTGCSCRSTATRAGDTTDEPPEFLQTFARACIDAGADAFLGHGPHITRAVEIYEGRPIFYSLGNFIFQNDTVRWQPAFNFESVGLGPDSTPADFYDRRSEDDTRGFPGDAIYWNSVVARCEYRSGDLSRIELHPIDLGHSKARSQRGRPVLADGRSSQHSLERMKRLSEPLGANVRVRDGVGVIEL